MSHEKKVLRNVINALKSGGYDAAVIVYEGSGDSGQVEDIGIYKPGEEPQSDGSYWMEGLSDEQQRAAQVERSAFLNDTKIEVTFTSSNFNHDTGEWVQHPKDELVPLLRGLDWLAYEWLSQRHPGWEINEGSYGHVVISVAEMQMSMEHSERIIEVNTFSHELSLGDSDK